MRLSSYWSWKSDSRMDPQTTCYNNVMTKFMINNGKDALKTDINLFYNIARALILCKSYWAIMNKLHARTSVLNKMTCAVSFQLQNFRRVYCSFRLFKFLSFGNVKVILSNPNPTSSLWLLPGKDVYFNVSILSLFVSIFIEYFYFVWLRFHYNLA